MVRFSALLLALSGQSQQVNILLTSGDDHRVEATCSNIAPGVCCLSPVPYGYGWTWGVTFENLVASDIAAIWDERVGSDQSTPFYNRRVGGCSGRVLESRVGPGTWQWFNWQANDIRPAGASYISLPRSLPPDQKTINALVIEGLLAMVWVRHIHAL